MNLLDRSRGCLLGLAAGDALGTTLEFCRPGSVGFKPVSDIVGGGPFGLKAGQWTDDTSMALCLAESLIEKRGFDPLDQLARYVRWWRKGHLSSTGKCFDIGGTTVAALQAFEKTGRADQASADEYTQGNGSIMRLAPVPIFFVNDPAEAIRRSGESSRTTHPHRACVDACRYLGGLIVGALRGEPKEKLLGPLYSPLGDAWRGEPLSPAIESVARGSFRAKVPPQIRGTGYVVQSLEAALWAFATAATFREGALLAANLGDDADTTAAIYGQLAGAHYGVGGAAGVPEAWRAKLALLDVIESLAAKLAGQ